MVEDDDFPHSLELRCAKIQNPVNGDDVDVKEIGWKHNRSDF
jgi:hypothetical protein